MRRMCDHTIAPPWICRRAAFESMCLSEIMERDMQRPSSTEYHERSFKHIICLYHDRSKYCTEKAMFQSAELVGENHWAHSHFDGPKQRRERFVLHVEIIHCLKIHFKVYMFIKLFVSSISNLYYCPPPPPVPTPPSRIIFQSPIATPCRHISYFKSIPCSSPLPSILTKIAQSPKSSQDKKKKRKPTRSSIQSGPNRDLNPGPLANELFDPKRESYD